MWRCGEQGTTRERGGGVSRQSSSAGQAQAAMMDGMIMMMASLRCATNVPVALQYVVVVSVLLPSHYFDFFSLFTTSELGRLTRFPVRISLCTKCDALPFAVSSTVVGRRRQINLLDTRQH